MDLPLDLAFKGGRDYLHGTDLHDAVRDAVAARWGDATSVDLSFHSLARSAVRLTDAAPAQQAVALCRCSAGGAPRQLWLVQTGHAVLGRRAYDEAAIVAALQVDAGQRLAVLDGDSGGSDIETWVAMIKRLHQLAFAERSGKWLFVRARLPRFAGAGGPGRREIRIAGVLGNRLTRSELRLDGQAAGEIFFALD